MMSCLPEARPICSLSPTCSVRADTLWEKSRQAFLRVMTKTVLFFLHWNTGFTDFLFPFLSSFFFFFWCMKSFWVCVFKNGMFLVCFFNTWGGMHFLPWPLKGSACSQTVALSGFVKLWNTLLLKLFWDSPRCGSVTFPCCLSLFPSEAPVRDVILHQTSGRIHNKNVSTHLIGSIARGERSAAWGLQPSSCPWWFFSTEWNQISCGREKNCERVLQEHRDLSLS